MIRVNGIDRKAVHAHLDGDGFSTMTFDGLTSPLLCAAFEHDVQTASDAETVREAIDSVTAGRESAVVLSGNSCSLIIHPSQITIENNILDEEEPIEMSVGQYRIFLEVWTELLSRRGGANEHA